MSTQQKNPFDDESHAFLLLINHLGQYSLWPDFSKVPDGWEVILGPDTRAVCIEYVEQNWNDIRPQYSVA
ncbi:MbtH family protein [Ketobacter sp. MCCC 1A13808]|uniref:MbtH family protein n=1 Tax=Ketobacter sp. MCCC 1A13808 TaxID=2602738 RepID=UPI000F0FDD98|nr:MbtH family protein [Ketobacter sp. MCCC 1A13808]MVF11562.1 MbtH family protein [Ketobacter sp. MCCC 1A13808]RLP55180.1 MAG: MbtH family protein [Ketobacter sp.]